MSFIKLTKRFSINFRRISLHLILPLCHPGPFIFFSFWITFVVVDTQFKCSFKVWIPFCERNNVAAKTFLNTIAHRIRNRYTDTQWTVITNLIFEVTTIVVKCDHIAIYIQKASKTDSGCELCSFRKIETLSVAVLWNSKSNFCHFD